MNDRTFQLELTQLTMDELYKLHDDVIAGRLELDERNMTKLTDYMASRMTKVDKLERILENSHD